MRRTSLAALALVPLAAMILAAAPPARSAQPGSTDEDLPAFGEYVHTEEMPEAIQRQAPVYPPLARQAGVEGTVTVHALVGRDGSVRGTRITQSVPMLDAAAMDAVRQWRFKPARTGGAPIACWVGIPVQFFLDGKPPKSDVAPTPPPVSPSAPGTSRTRQRITVDRLRELPVQRLFVGTYFINSDSADRVIVTREKGDRVRLESPGQWRGKGTFDGRTYRGTFEYLRTAPDPRNRGARGTHVGTLRSDGLMFVEGAFTNRGWPPFRSNWTPFDGWLHFRGESGREPHYQQDGRDIPIQRLEPEREPGRIEHPVWPPEGRPVPEHQIEHPIWPPEWFKGDLSIVLAGDARVDSPPQVAQRVEPRWDTRHAQRAIGRDDLVVVQAMIEPDGSVSDARIAQSIPELDAAALEAVRQWRFRAALKAGQPVRAEVYVPLRFVKRNLGRGLMP